MIVSKFMPIGIIFVCVFAGAISFYFISDLSKQIKKQYIKELISQLINFIIFLWIGKIVLNLSVFVTDPLAILAYPSDSSAFYFAVLASIIVLGFKYKREKVNIQVFIDTFLSVFLTASFLDAFIQFVWNGDTYAFHYLILVFILLIVYYLTSKKISIDILFIMLIAVWAAGIWLLTLIQPYVAAFGYMIEPWFAGLFLIVNLVFIMFMRKRDRNGRN